MNKLPIYHQYINQYFQLVATRADQTDGNADFHLNIPLLPGAWQEISFGQVLQASSMRLHMDLGVKPLIWQQVCQKPFALKVSQRSAYWSADRLHAQNSKQAAVDICASFSAGHTRRQAQGTKKPDWSIAVPFLINIINVIVVAFPFNIISENLPRFNSQGSDSNP